MKPFDGKKYEFENLSRTVNSVLIILGSSWGGNEVIFPEIEYPYDYITRCLINAAQ